MLGMNTLYVIALLLLQSVAAATPQAQPSRTQDHEQIRNAVSDFLRGQTATLPGKFTYKVDEIDRRLLLPKCPTLEAFLPAGNRLAGKTSIGVRCVPHERGGENDRDPSNRTWSIFVPVQITLNLNLLISARQLPPGHTLQEQDIARQDSESSQPGVFTDPIQVIGKVLRYGISAGQVLREDMLRPPYSVTQGQVVQLFVQGSRFSIRSEGVVLNNAAEGQTVQVRVPSGRVISGVTRSGGLVEITP